VVQHEVFTLQLWQSGFPASQRYLAARPPSLLISDLVNIGFRHDRGIIMWYFAWILGVLLACAFGIINVMWMETEEMLGSDNNSEN
jgi:cyd operon protein YbgT